MDVAAIVARVDEWTNQPETRERFHRQVRRYADLIEQRSAAVQQHKAACIERVREVLRRGHLDERERPAAADDRWTYRGFAVWAPTSPALARVRARAEHPLPSRQQAAAAKALLAALDSGRATGIPYEVVCWLPPAPPDPSDPDHWAPSKRLAPETPLALRAPRLGEEDALTVPYVALLSLRDRELARPRLPEGLTPIQHHHIRALADLYERHAEEMLRSVAGDLKAARRAVMTREVSTSPSDGAARRKKRKLPEEAAEQIRRWTEVTAALYQPGPTPGAALLGRVEAGPRDSAVAPDPLVAKYERAVRGILQRDHAELAERFSLNRWPAKDPTTGNHYGDPMQARRAVAMHRAAKECADGHKAWLAAGCPRLNLDLWDQPTPEAGTIAAGPAVKAHESAANGDYQPATWFPKGMAARLRMAARKDRKTKRVATQMIDGVVCYSVADARRWWPRDVPKEP
jgi:hypothetical protein